jgi:hypothetical protein
MIFWSMARYIRMRAAQMTASDLLFWAISQVDGHLAVIVWKTFPPPPPPPPHAIPGP